MTLINWLLKNRVKIVSFNLKISNSLITFEEVNKIKFSIKLYLVSYTDHFKVLKLISWWT